MIHMTSKIIVYGTPICPMVAPIRSVLDRAEAIYEYVDISRDAQARETVRAINHGNESVPPLRFPDGSTLTEPSTGQLAAKLTTIGYTVHPATWLEKIRLVGENLTVRLFGLIFLVLCNGQQDVAVQISWQDYNRLRNERMASDFIRLFPHPL